MNLDIDTLFHTARRLHQAGMHEAAVLSYEDLLAAEPQHPHAPYLLGVALVHLKRAEEALPLLRGVAERRPGHVPTWCALGDALVQLERYPEGGAAYEKALNVDPQSLDAARGMANLLTVEKKWEPLLGFARALQKVHPDVEEVLGFVLRALDGLERRAEAAFVCAQFLQSHPDAKPVYKWMTDLLKDVKKPDTSFCNLLADLQEPQGRALYIQACVAAKDGESAVAAFLHLRKDDPEGEHLSLAKFADLLQGAELFQAAEPFHWELMERDVFDDKRLKRLIENTLGRAKNDMPEKYIEAKELAEILYQRCPDDINSPLLMGNIYMAASRPELALPYYDRVLEMNPKHPIRSAYLFNLNYDEARSPEAIFDAHKSWGNEFEKANRSKDVAFLNQPMPERRLRVGYLSPDIGQHPVGHFLIGVIKGHDPENIEIFLYSNREAEVGDDALSKEFREHVGEDHWRWTRGMPAARLVEKIREDEIDVLIDLAGHTAHNRLDVFAARAAPVQVSWLGYANTTGLSRIDYRLSDAIVEPEGDADARSTEKICRLPNGFHMFRMQDHFPEPSAPPCLKRGYITFGTYNNMNKLGSESVALWSRLLHRVPDSRIIVKHKSLRVLNNRESLRSLFAMHGIQSWRVELLANTSGHREHLETYSEIDIALDPLAYNGTTTTCDALLMGVPVLTMPGCTHASRVSASLLHRVGMDNWIAGDEDEFIRIGALAAQAPEMLTDLRGRLRQAFMDSPLGDGVGMAADIENALRDMWRQWCEENHGVVVEREAELVC